MSTRNDIQDLVMGFFRTIGSDISDVGGVHAIGIPEEYHNVFGTDRLKIAFDESVSSKHDCELVTLGSRILLQIIEICIPKGPIALKTMSTDTYKKAIIRYHFFTHFSGRRDDFMLEHVDVALDFILPSSMDVDNTHNPSSIRWLPPKEITRTYTVATNQLEQFYNDKTELFLNRANQEFEKELKTVLSQHDSRIRELDDSIHQKDINSDSYEKSREFRFKTIEKIEEIAKQRENIADTLQEKHKILFNYELIACEIILA